MVGPIKNLNRRKIEFYSKIDEPDENGCENWNHTQTTGGYGNCKFKIYDKVFNGAHRIAYILEYGDVLGDKVICHKCDNPLCCNVNHLRMDTPKANSQEMVTKGRGRQKGYTQTEEHIKRQSEARTFFFSQEQIDEMRERFNNGETLYSIAESFGVGQTTIHRRIHKYEG